MSDNFRAFTVISCMIAAAIALCCFLGAIKEDYVLVVKRREKNGAV